MARIMIPRAFLCFICLLFLCLFTASGALAQRVTLVSVARDDTAAATAEDPVVSANGRFVAFHSSAFNLVANDFNGRRDVFVRDLQTGTTTLVSVNRFGIETGDGASQKPTISADGRYVAFESDADDLVPNDTNKQSDIFLRDLQTGTTTLVSVNHARTGSANQSSLNAVITANARYVAFSSFASDIVDFDNNNTIDIFVYSIAGGQLRMVSCDLTGTSPGNAASYMPNLPRDKAPRAVFSKDGRYLVFESQATNLTLTADPNGHSPDVFVRDLDVGITKVLSADPLLTATANGASTTPVISGNGRFVFFQSTATNLVPNDTNNGLDLFVCDLNSNEKTLVSVTTTNTGSNIHPSSQFFPVASDDGRYVIFQSDAKTYVTNDSNNEIDVFRRDLQANTTTLVSVSTSGGTSAGNSVLGAVMSANGRFVAFIGFGAGFTTTTDTNGQGDVFVRDIDLGTTTLLSTNIAGTAAADLGATFPVISADGRFVLFESSSTDLVPNKTTNTATQIFATALNGRVKLDVSALNRDETSGNASVSVSRTGNTSDVVTVQYTTVSGTAQSPADFSTISASLTFAAGETSKTLVVPILDDALDEDDETFMLVLSDFNAASENSGSLSSAVLTIADDDPTPSVSIDDVSIVEGSAGTKRAEFTLTLSAASGRFIAVVANTMPLTASPVSDFESPLFIVGFEPGTTSTTIGVPVFGDTTFEDDETFVLNLGSPLNVTIARGQGLGTIINDDPVPTISINNITLSEGSTGTRLFLFNVTLSNPSDRTITVQSATADNTAKANSDYTPFSGTLSFAPGVTTRMVSVEVNSDQTVEPDETFFVNLTLPTEATIAAAQGIGTIQNDDLPVLLTEEKSENAAALDLVLFLRDPFPLSTKYLLGPEVRTRVSLFALHLDPGEPLAALTVSAEDNLGGIYLLPVEFVGAVPEVDGLSQIVVRLPDGINNATELKLKLTVHGQASNVAPIRIAAL
jgi:Calx-beta domain/WD40-like Beta Propeller Repeat